MFALSNRPADLFILYPPGARGDFLAAILKNHLSHQYTEYVINPPENFQKAHWAKDLGTVEIPKFKNKIRIKLSGPDDFLTVAYLRKEKTMLYGPWGAVIHQLWENETQCLKLDSMFDYVVEFRQLYDIEFIKKLYFDINSVNLSSEDIEKIQYNINLQPWVKLQDYTW